MGERGNEIEKMGLEIKGFEFRLFSLIFEFVMHT